MHTSTTAEVALDFQGKRERDKDRRRIFVDEIDCRLSFFAVSCCSDAAHPPILEWLCGSRGILWGACVAATLARETCLRRAESICGDARVAGDGEPGLSEEELQSLEQEEEGDEDRGTGEGDEVVSSLGSGVSARTADALPQVLPTLGT